MAVLRLCSFQYPLSCRSHRPRGQDYQRRSPQSMQAWPGAMIPSLLKLKSEQQQRVATAATSGTAKTPGFSSLMMRERRGCHKVSQPDPARSPIASALLVRSVRRSALWGTSCTLFTASSSARHSVGQKQFGRTPIQLLWPGDPNGHSSVNGTPLTWNVIP